MKSKGNDMKLNLQFFGSRGASSASDTEAKKLQQHFEKENARIEAFLQSRDGSITMENGDIIERYTQKEMLTILRDFKDYGVMDDDMAIDIMYKDGTYKGYRGGDDTSKMKLSNIDTIIYTNDATQGFSGKNIKIENYREIYENWGNDDDWRVDFARYYK